MCENRKRGGLLWDFLEWFGRGCQEWSFFTAGLVMIWRCRAFYATKTLQQRTGNQNIERGGKKQCRSGMVWLLIPCTIRSYVNIFGWAGVWTFWILFFIQLMNSFLNFIPFAFPRYFSIKNRCSYSLNGQ
jgi:hypothetical protein